MRQRLLLSCILLLVTACAQNAETIDAALAAARAKWAGASIDDYRFTLRRDCFCRRDTAEGAGTFDITVENGVITSASNRETGRQYSAQDISDLPTIDGLFDHVQFAYVHGADDVQVHYEATYGYPSAIDIDWIREGVDDEISYDVLEFNR